MARIEVYRDSAKEWRWTKRSGSDVVADSGEGYERKDSAVEAAQNEARPGDTLVVRNADGSTQENAVT